MGFLTQLLCIVMILCLIAGIALGAWELLKYERARKHQHTPVAVTEAVPTPTAVPMTAASTAAPVT